MKTDSTFTEHTNCEGCGSSDANAVYSDGHTYCHACETYLRGDDVPPDKPKEKRVSNTKLRHDGKDSSLHDRNISKETAMHFGVQVVAKGQDRTHHIYPYYKDGQLVAQKIRDIKEKTFHALGDIGEAELFGQHLGTGKKFLTICEGECDAMAAWQMMKFPDATVVSVKTGANLKDFKDEATHEWADNFNEIRIAFDGDEKGQTAAKRLAELFSPGKAKIVEFTGEYKDPNDFLLKGKEKEFNKLWWDAKTHQPDGLVNGRDLKERIKNKKNVKCIAGPWSGMDELTYGFRTGEMWTLTAGSGMGKTQILRELEHHFLKTTDWDIGALFLEETAEDSGEGLMSIECNKPLHLPDTHVNDTEWEQTYERTLGTGRITYYDAFGESDIDRILSRIRYLSKGLGCKVIFLDHISIIVSDQTNGDERKALDSIATKLKKLTMELDVLLLMVSHSKRQSNKPHEEGGTTSLSDLRGTAGIGQLSNIVLGFERNGQHEDLRERNTTTVRVLKNRFSGLTGPSCRLYYDNVTGRLNEEEMEVDDD